MTVKITLIPSKKIIILQRKTNKIINRMDKIITKIKIHQIIKIIIKITPIKMFHKDLNKILLSIRKETMQRKNKTVILTKVVVD